MNNVVLAKREERERISLGMERSSNPMSLLKSSVAAAKKNKEVCRTR